MEEQRVCLRVIVHALPSQCPACWRSWIPVLVLPGTGGPVSPLFMGVNMGVPGEVSLKLLALLCPSP